LIILQKLEQIKKVVDPLCPRMSPIEGLEQSQI